ncbi:adhesion domain-containing protein, partial [Escherichia coli]
NMYAQLYQLTIESNKLPVMFTVITSPDTPLASYWGHMPETFTTRSGIAFKRPLLTAEHPAGQSTMANNESWLSLNTAAKNDVSKSDCGEPYQ